MFPSRPSPTLKSHGANSESASARMLSESDSCSKKGQSVLDLRHAEACWAEVPCGTTGRHCRKSPPRTRHFPPNGASVLMRSRKSRSIHPSMSLCAMELSSHMSKVAFLRSVASLLLGRMWEVLFSWHGTGKPNCLCAVIPLMSVAAMPVEATHSTDLPVARTLCVSVWYRYDFPEPPGPSKKKQLPWPVSMAAMILS